MVIGDTSIASNPKFWLYWSVYSINSCFKFIKVKKFIKSPIVLKSTFQLQRYEKKNYKVLLKKLRFFIKQNLKEPRWEIVYLFNDGRFFTCIDHTPNLIYLNGLELKKPFEMVHNISEKISNSFSILEDCLRLKITIPHFCFHKELSIAGNCRMCVIYLTEITLKHELRLRKKETLSEKFRTRVFLDVIINLPFHDFLYKRQFLTSIPYLPLQTITKKQLLKPSSKIKSLFLEGKSRLILSCTSNFNSSFKLNQKKIRFFETTHPLAYNARSDVLEFLLKNHPLDCPICDQGGECDLQELTHVYGNIFNKFSGVRRSVVDKTFGLIKTIMNRCIHCTRCVRFLETYTKNTNLGVIGRGSNMEVSTYLNENINSNLSGNIIDLCPVGALTLSAFRFNNRPWELKAYHTVDILDAFASPINFLIKDKILLKVKPRKVLTAELQLISNNTRYAFVDSLRFKNQHIRSSKLYNKKPIFDSLAVKNEITSLNSLRLNVSNQLLFEFISNYFKICHNFASSLMHTTGIPGLLKDYFNIKRILFISGTETPIVLLQSFFELSLQIQGGLFYTSNDFLSKVSADFQINFLFNTSLNQFNKSDLCILIDVDLEYEAVKLYAKLVALKKVNFNSFKIMSIGNFKYSFQIDRYFPKKELALFLEGTHDLNTFLNQAKLPIVIFGNSVLNISFYNTLIINNLKNLILNSNLLCPEYNWNGLNFISNSMTSYGLHSLGLPQVFQAIYSRTLTQTLARFFKQEQRFSTFLSFFNPIKAKKHKNYILYFDRPNLITKLTSFVTLFLQKNIVIYQGDFLPQVIPILSINLLLPTVNFFSTMNTVTTLFGIRKRILPVFPVNNSLIFTTNQFSLENTILYKKWFYPVLSSFLVVNSYSSYIALNIKNKKKSNKTLYRSNVLSLSKKLLALGNALLRRLGSKENGLLQFVTSDFFRCFSTYYNLLFFFNLNTNFLANNAFINNSVILTTNYKQSILTYSPVFN